MTQSYTGSLPYSDESNERVDNSEHIQVGLTGLKRVALFDANGVFAGNIGWDYISLTQDSTTDTYTFKTGGSGGTTVLTIVVTFTDSGKGTISTVTKS